MKVIIPDKPRCVNCKKHNVKKFFSYSKNEEYVKFVCQDCGHTWVSHNKEKDVWESDYYLDNKVELIY